MVEVLLTFVTRSVAKSSRSPYFEPPIFSPAPLSPRKAGGTYEPFLAAAPEANPPVSPLILPMPSSECSAPEPRPAPVSPMGAIVSLYGHLAVKCSPLQIRHLTFLSLSLSFMATAFGSADSSLASLRHVAEGRKIMFSPTEVVSVAGPAPSEADAPNLVHDLRSATRGFTTSRTLVSRIRRVVFTFCPCSFSR